MISEEGAVSLNDHHSKTEYKISLTDYSLDLFPMSRSIKGLHVDKLWSADKTRNMFQECSNEYYQYKLMSDEANNDNVRQENNLTSAMIDCHLCNLSIPKTYAAEHNDSDKHNVCLKLAKVVLERTNKQLTNQINYYETKPKDTYYCPSCNFNIKEESRGTHENDTKHKLEKKRDQLFSILLEIYMNDNITDVSHDDLKLEDDDKITDATFEETFISCSDKDSLESQTTAELTDVELKIPILKDLDTVNLKLVSLAPVKMSTQTANCAVCNSPGDSYSIKNVLDELTHTDSFQKALSYDTDSNENNFDDVNKKSNNLHLVNQNHFPWKSSDTMVVMDHNTHNMNLHNINDSKIATGCATLNVHSQTKADVSQTNARTVNLHCKLCDVLPGVGNYEAHVKGRRHRENVKLQAEQDLNRANDNVSVVDNATNKTYGYVEAISNMQEGKDPKDGNKNLQYHCHICNLKVPFHPNNIAEHNKGFRHVSLLLTDEPISIVADSKINNSVNNEVSKEMLHVDKVLKNSKLDNVNDNTNRKAVTNAIDGQTEADVTTKNSHYINALCTLCNVLPGVGNYEAHIKGRRHRENVKLQAQQTQPSNTNADVCQTIAKMTEVPEAIESPQYYCILCKVSVPNHPDNIESHKKDVLHVAKLAKHLDKLKASSLD